MSYIGHATVLERSCLTPVFRHHETDLAQRAQRRSAKGWVTGSEAELEKFTPTCCLFLHNFCRGKNLTVSYALMLYFCVLGTVYRT